MNAPTDLNAQEIAPNLWRFQRQFGDYLRHQKDDNAVPQRVGKLYQQLIWNNFTGFINQCFPICKKIVDETTWQQLQRCFFNEGTLDTPYFNEISQAFVKFLQDNLDVLSDLNLPPFFAELAHYEWVELYVDNLTDKVPCAFLPSVALNPSVQALHYQWAVTKIGVDYQPDTPEDCFVLVYRKAVDGKYQVAFMAINALTYLLIDFIAKGGVYHDHEQLLTAFSQTVELPIEPLLPLMADLLATMLDNQVFLSI